MQSDKRVRAVETTVGRAMRALVLENELLSTTLLLDQGADIHTLTYKPKGVDVMWRPPRPPREPGIGPTPAGDSVALWMAYYRGGWQVIFPNFGPPTEYKGALLDMHGEAARTVATGERNGHAPNLTGRRDPGPGPGDGMRHGEWVGERRVPQAPRSDTGHRLALLPARS